MCLLLDIRVFLILLDIRQLFIGYIATGAQLSADKLIRQSAVAAVGGIDDSACLDYDISVRQCRTRGVYFSRWHINYRSRCGTDSESEPAICMLTGKMLLTYYTVDLLCTALDVRHVDIVLCGCTICAFVIVIERNKNISLQGKVFRACDFSDWLTNGATPASCIIMLHGASILSLWQITIMHSSFSLAWITDYSSNNDFATRRCYR